MIEIGIPGSKASGLSTTQRRLSKPKNPPILACFGQRNDCLEIFYLLFIFYVIPCLYHTMPWLSHMQPLFPLWIRPWGTDPPH